MLVNVAVAAAFLVPRKKRNTLLLASVAAAAVLQAGRLVDAPRIPADHAALLVQENIPVDENWTRDTFERTLRELTDLTVKAANPRIIGGVPEKLELIVWPESPAPFFANDPLFREPVSEMARQTRSWVVTGAIGSTSAMQNGGPASEVFNSAALVSPSGDWTARYDKVHLVPFGEYLPFSEVVFFCRRADQKKLENSPREHPERRWKAGSERLGVFICYESVFPDEVRQFANNGAQVFVNISNDGWYGDSGAYAQHLNQTRMRAIENDRWILSATDTG